MRATLRVLCTAALLLAAHDLFAQTVKPKITTLKGCQDAGDEQYIECVDWGHNASLCAETWVLVMELCEEQFPT